ncbi:hypothetical protein TGP89_209680 [Toxoplasma gondii p89]|uniref:Uncharacterized protein n=1 Tax=Toxoplasma gondii p89 TaxID=943119 RepID=A0A086JAM7_TOXGO|nr:hypothetical protein TGP89_209680 [Toxoplasma gondii p89]
MATRTSFPRSLSQQLFRPLALFPLRDGTRSLAFESRPRRLTSLPHLPWQPRSVSAASSTVNHLPGLKPCAHRPSPGSFSSPREQPTSLLSVESRSSLPAQGRLSFSSLSSRVGVRSSFRTQRDVGKRRDPLWLRQSGRFFVTGTGQPARTASRDEQMKNSAEDLSSPRNREDTFDSTDVKKEVTNEKELEKQVEAMAAESSSSDASSFSGASVQDKPSTTSATMSSASGSVSPPASAGSSSPSPSSSPLSESSSSSQDKEKPQETSENKWGFRHYFFGSLGLGLAGGFVYVLAENDFNVAKAEWAIGEKIRARVFKYTRNGPRQEAADNSKFSVGLSEELQKEIALFFLQLDLDKPNGVRRSDVMELVKKLGFSPSSGVCKIFLENGQGRTADVKRVSGVTLQDFAELLEGLILEEELEAAGGSEPTEADSSSGLFNAEETEQGTSTDPATHAQGERRKENSHDRLLNYFRGVNRTTTMPSTVPPCYTESAHEIPPSRMNSQGKTSGEVAPLNDATGAATGGQNGQDAEADSSANELQLLQLQLAGAEKLVKDLSSLKARRGLSDAENARLENAKSEVKTVQQEIWRVEAASGQK